tara:strand:- start:2144 stop:2893 length:750 start_codon:yes stop_codon:yes gene_type:complete
MIVTTEREREILREGGSILGTILYAVANRCVPGVSLLELDQYARTLMEAHNVKPSFLGFHDFPAALCISVNEGVVHGIPDEYILKDGDILTLDGGVWHEGLCTDAALTVGVGNIAQEDQNLIRAAREAREAQIAAAVAGNTIGDIGAASEKVARKYGYDYPHELGGHGVGREVHEPPFVPNYGKRGTGEVLKEGMVLALEPILINGNGKVTLANDGWLYETVDGSRAAQFEHTVIVGKDKAEVLTDAIH